MAKFQPVKSNGESEGHPAALVTDGDVATAWRSNGPGPAEMSIELPVKIALQSVHLYLGGDGGPAPSEFSLDFWDGTVWKPLPGGIFSGNREFMLNVRLHAPVTTDKLRLRSPGNMTVGEIAMFSATDRDGIPLGADVSLNLAKRRVVAASSSDGKHFARLAVDGYAGSGSDAWWTGGAGAISTLVVELPGETRLGCAQLFSGSDESPAVADFSLQAWNGTSWTDIPGTGIQGNTRKEIALDFMPLTTSKVKLLVRGGNKQVVRELVLLPPCPGAGRFALGTDVIRKDPPTTKWEDFSDCWWKIVSDAGGAALETGTTKMMRAKTADDGKAGQFQILYNYDSDTFRIRNRSNLKCLAAGSLELQPGVGVGESDYHAMPHELWRLEPAGGNRHRIVNVWNGLAIQADDGAGVSLVTKSDDRRQAWRTEPAAIHPKKGLADVRNDYDQLGVSWEYNWARDPRVRELPPEIAYCPMWWNTAGLTTHPVYQSRWQRDARPIALLGFNEPDLAIESNLSPEQAVAAWPLLEASGLPLLSPAPAASFSGWMDKFSQQAEAAGCRVDYIGAHCYLDPFPGALVGYLEKIHQQWGKPVWLTEFAGYDTSGFAHYTEEQHYQFIADFLWIAEDLPWLKRYSMFPFYIDPAPYPWDATPDRRTAMFNSSGSALTAIGELYAAWDADRTIKPRTAYCLFNKGTSFKIARTDSDAPATRDIRANDTAVQWCFDPVSGRDVCHIVSLWDGSKLGWANGRLVMAAASVEGPAVEWQWTADPSDKYGCFFIDHPASGQRLRMDRSPEKGMPVSVTLSMGTRDMQDQQMRWRFIKPLRPGNLNGPMALQAAAGNKRVYLKWKAMPGAMTYDVQRSATAGGPYERIATVSDVRYEDKNLVNGTTLYYVISKSGASGAVSAAAGAIPGWLANPGFEIPATTEFKLSPTGGGWSFGPPHEGDQAGVTSNSSGYANANPKAPEGAQAAFLQGKGVIRQQLTGLVAGTEYQVAFSAAQRGSFQTAGQTWDLMVDGAVIGRYDPPQSSVDYTRYAASFVANAPCQVLSFVGTNTRGGDNTVMIDAVSVALKAAESQR